jgi:hypothetical protein
MKHYTINGKDMHHLNHTALDPLPVILAASAMSSFDSTTNAMRHDVDTANLKALINEADQTMHGLIDAVRAIGGLLAYVDHKEIGDTVNSVGWVLSGIAGIARNVHDAGVAFNEDLQSRKA